jgi:hypothetical protein
MKEEFFIYYGAEGKPYTNMTEIYRPTDVTSQISVTWCSSHITN